ncbi:MAG: response regulator transcription factor [Solirubrobacterales bacterium]|nr:response regulator transcription factor [Solirubrobacterales bacterium]
MKVVPMDGRDPGHSEVLDGPEAEVSVVIADDDVAMRIGVRRVLRSAGLNVLADVSSASEAIAAALSTSPDICLVGTEIPGSGIMAAERIKGALPTTKIVMLSPSEREDEMFAALGAGADGYVAKSVSAEQLVYALRGVANGEAALSRRMTARLIREFQTRGSQRRLQITIAGQPVDLTAREFEILERLRREESTAAIAQQFRISEVTVRRHASAIVRKLGVRDRRAVIQLLKAS